LKNAFYKNLKRKTFYYYNVIDLYFANVGILFIVYNVPLSASGPTITAKMCSSEKKLGE